MTFRKIKQGRKYLAVFYGNKEKTNEIFFPVKIISKKEKNLVEVQMLTYSKFYDTYYETSHYHTISCERILKKVLDK